MAFDPDAFIAGGAAVAEPPAFDPDAFLSEEAPFDPDAFLSAPEPADESADFFAGGVPSENLQQFIQPAAPNALSPSVISEENEPIASAGVINLERAAKQLSPLYVASELLSGKTLDEVRAETTAPIVTFPKPLGDSVPAGIARGSLNVLDSLTSPENIALLASLEGAPAVAHKIVAGGFSAQMATHLPEQIAAAAEAKTPGEIAEKSTEAVATAAMALLGAKHAAGRPGRGGIAPGETRPPSLTQAQVDARLTPTEPVRSSQPVTPTAEPLPTTLEPVPESLAEGGKVAAESKPAGGPGAMGPVEAAEMAAANRTTGVKNAQVEAERIMRGEEPMTKEEPLPNRQAIAEAVQAIEKDPSRPDVIIESINSSTRDARSISVADQAVLMAHKVDLIRKRAEQESIYGDGNRTPEEHAVAAQKLTEIEQRMNQVDQATEAMGTEGGRFLQLRQRLLQQDYSLEAMERKARIQKGDALTPEESVKIKEQAAKISDLEKQLEEATKGAKEKEGEVAADTAFKDTKKKADAENTKTGKKNLDTERESLVSAIGERAKEGDTPNDLRSFVQRLALNLVRSGVTERAPLVERVHGVLAEIYPDITKAQSRDLISGYGDVRYLDKEAAKVTLRGLKGELQQVSKIEALEKAIAEKSKVNPLKPSGPEREKMTDEARRLQKEVNELKKKGDFVTTDPATQLKSARDAIKTRLQNEIRDLDHAMATKEPLAKKTGGVEYDAEMKALKEQRDAKKAQYDELFPKEPLSDAQVLDRMGKSLDRSIADLETSLKDGRIYPDKASRKLTSTEIEAKRARLEALRQERQQLRDLDTVRVEAQKEAKLLEAIDKAQKATPEPAEGTPTADTARIAELKRTLQEARDAKASSPEAMNLKIEQATEAVRKQISELDRRIREGDVATKEGKDALRSNELDALRSERDALESYLREERNRLKPRKSADELALQSYKTRTANRIAELNEKIAKGDFSPRPKPEAPKLDRDALDLKVKIEQVKEQYNKALVDFKMSNRTLPERLVGAAAETSNLQRAIFTGLDLSAILNQGGFIVLGAPFHPIRTFHALKAMVQGMRSGEGKIGVMENIKKRANYPLYEKAKLFLSNSKTGSLHAAEEAFMSRWLDKMELSTQEGLKGTALRTMQRSVNTLLAPVRASERAYTTFLNQLRVETFDRMKASFESKNGPVDIAGARVIADFVNTATGRGGFGKFEPAGVALSTVFFSPRFVISRLGLLTGEPMWRGNAATRQLIAKEYGKYAVGVATFYALGIAGGGEIETDPRSSDFGKLRFGNVRIDPLVGMAQLLVFMSRTATGETKDSQGRIIPLRGHDRPLDWLRKQGWLDDKPEPFNAKNPMQKKWLKVLTSFVRSKAAPVPGAILGGLAGEDFAGQETSILNELSKIIAPMSSQAIYKTMKENGLTAGVALTIAQILGARVSQYEDRFDREAHK